MAYWLSEEPELVKDEAPREEPYATWLRELYAKLEGNLKNVNPPSHPHLS